MSRRTGLSRRINTILPFFRVLRITWLLAGTLLVASACPGITIDVVYDATNSVEPNIDLDGSLLTSIVRSAADRWEGILEDNHTMKINIRWDNPANANNALAIAPIVTSNAAENRTVEGTIIFSNAPVNAMGNPIPWFLDTTPDEDEEFNMGQTLFRDLTPADQAAIYTVTTNNQLLEEGIWGLANTPAAQNGTDLLSVAVHELGHHMGVTNQLAKAMDEWQNDGDYDLPPELLGGRIIAARVPANFGHLTGGVLGGNSGNLMQPFIPIGRRRLASATDVFAAAAVGNWTSIDLARQDFTAGSTWGTAGNWMGNQIPGSDDDAFIRLGGDVFLDIDDSVANLTVADSTFFYTGANRLDVAGTTTIAFDGTFPFAQIFVEPGGELETNDLDIAGGELDMNGGLADIQNRVTITRNLTGGSISGFGTVDVQNQLINNGLISADGGTLNFTSNNTADVFDLDGTLGNGEVRALQGNIVFSGPTAPTFVGEMRIGAGRLIEINDEWQLTIAGEISLEGSTTQDADLRGAPVTVSGTIDVDQRARLNLPATFNSSANVNLPDSDDRLQLGTRRTHAITYNGGSFTGDGTLVQNGDATVPIGRTQTINVANFDWDGTTASSTTLLAGSQLTLDIETLNDEHDGEIFLHNATLEVTTAAGSWDLRSTATFNPLGAGSSRINGSTLNVLAGGQLHFQGGTGIVNPQVGMLGNMLVQGIADFNGTIGFGSSSTTTLDGGILRFNAFTNYNGSTIGGTGAIQQNGTGFIVDSQTINLTGAFDWDGASNNSQFFINPGKTFNLTATSINLGNDIYSGQLNLIAGTANVDVASNRWTMAGTLRMTGAVGDTGGIVGDDVDITGHVETVNLGQHFIAATSRFLTGSTTTVGTNTELVFNAPVTWEDGTHNGIGTISVNDRGTFGGGQMNIIRFEVGGAAEFNLEGGRLLAETFDPSTGDFNFLGGRLGFDTYLGDLHNQAGTFAPGSSTRVATIDGTYVQDATGIFEVDLFSTSLNSGFDRLVADSATLDGTLEVLLGGGFVPAIGDTFQIISAGISDTFDNVLFPNLAGLGWEINYEPTAVLLEVIEAGLVGDYNNDGVVNAADYVVWRNSEGESGPDLPADGDGSGTVGPEDYDLWQAKFGAVVASAANASTLNASGAAAVPEPTGAMLLGALAVLALPLRRRGGEDATVDRRGWRR